MGHILALATWSGALIRKFSKLLLRYDFSPQGHPGLCIIKFLDSVTSIQMGVYKVSEELIEAITNATKPPAIVHNVPARSENLWGWEARFLKAFIGSQGHSIYDLENKKKAAKTFNIRDADPDFENCNGRALTVTTKDMKVLKGSNIGIFMVNLTKVCQKPADLAFFIIFLEKLGRLLTVKSVGCVYTITDR